MVEQKTFIPSTWAGGLVGLFIGYLWVRFGIGHTLLIAFLGIVGYVSGGILRGEIDLLDQLTRLQQRNKNF